MEAKIARDHLSFVSANANSKSVRSSAGSRAVDHIWSLFDKVSLLEEAITWARTDTVYRRRSYFLSSISRLRNPVFYECETWWDVCLQAALPGHSTVTYSILTANFTTAHPSFKDITDPKTIYPSAVSPPIASIRKQTGTIRLALRAAPGQAAGRTVMESRTSAKHARCSAQLLLHNTRNVQGPQCVGPENTAVHYVGAENVESSM